MQKYILQQDGLQDSLSWQIQPVGRTEGHQPVLLRRLAVPLLYREKRRELRVQGIAAGTGAGPRRQDSLHLSHFAASRERTFKKD